MARNHAKKRLVKQGKHIGSSFKNRENIKQKQRPVIFAKNGRFNSGQNGRIRISLEFPCKNFLYLKSVCTWYILFLKLLIPPSKVKWSRGPCHDHLFISFNNQIHLASVKRRVKGTTITSVSKATKDLSSESSFKTQWKTGFYYITGLVLNSLYSTVDLLIPYTSCLLWSF